MAIICIFFPIIFIILPIAFAISPEVPESISSKTNVGKSIFLDKIDFKANNIRDFSPPEAIFESYLGLDCSLGLYKTSMLLIPFLLNSSDSVRLKSILEFFNARFLNADSMPI